MVHSRGSDKTTTRSRHKRMVDIQKEALSDGHSETGTGRPRSPQDRSSEHDSGGTALMISCFCGIFVSYFIYGLLQEKITKENYGEEKFQYFMFLVGVQCVVNAAFAKTVAVVRSTPVSLGPHKLFSMLAFTYVGAMVASNSALSFIPYPTQVLGKCAKPIPVMILGVLIGDRVYPRLKYLIVLLIVIGVVLFRYKDKGTPDSSDEQTKIFNILGIGEVLIIASLCLDGLTGVFQDRLKSKHSVKAHHMMYAVNVYSAVYLGVAMFLTGEGVEAIAFVQRHPHVIYRILVFGVSSAIGQNFIFLTVTNYGPLTCSLFTTTRKFFTILGSVIIFSHPLLGRQWLGVVLVFVGLGLDMYFGKAIKKTHHHHNVTIEHDTKSSIV